MYSVLCIGLCMLERTMIFACPVEIAQLDSFIIVHLHLINLYHLITIHQGIRFFRSICEHKVDMCPCDSGLMMSDCQQSSASG